MYLPKESVLNSEYQPPPIQGDLTCRFNVISSHLKAKYKKGINEYSKYKKGINEYAKYNKNLVYPKIVLIALFYRFIQKSLR